MSERDPLRQHDPGAIERIVRRAVQNGRVHDDQITGSAGHFFKPDGVGADPRLDIDKRPQVGGRGAEQVGEPGVFGLEPIAHPR